MVYTKNSDKHTTFVGDTSCKLHLVFWIDNSMNKWFSWRHQKFKLYCL